MTSMTENEKEFKDTYAGQPIKQRPELPNPLILGKITFANPLTQTTVGGVGGASPLPLTPVGYLKINIGKNEYVIPYYLVS